MTNSYELKFFTNQAHEMMVVFQAYVDMLTQRLQARKQELMVERAKQRQEELEEEE